MKPVKFWMVGGDRRQIVLSGFLRQDGHLVRTFALEEEDGASEVDLLDAAWADCVILPLPSEGKEGMLHAPLAQVAIPLEEVLAALPSGTAVLGGRLGEKTIRAGERRGLRMADYFLREELTVANAVPTAEGAIQLAMENLPVTLWGCRTAVLGYGRIGRITAHRLRGLGAVVTVAARKEEQLTWARVDGCEAHPLSHPERWLSGQRLIINTIPSVVLTPPLLRKVSGDCLIIDVASAPGGADLTAAEKLGVHVILAPGLPGKVAPETAAEIIRDTVYHILEEWGV